MENLITYRNFKKDIQEGFHEIINKFNFSTKEVREGKYELVNEYCIISFTYDRGDIFCDIQRSGSDEKAFGVFEVFKFLYPNCNLTKELSTRVWKPREQIFRYAFLILEKLTGILQGDFSWENSLILKDEWNKKLMGFLHTLDNNHPLNQKFWNGDPNWKSEVEGYLKENHIIL